MVHREPVEPQTRHSWWAERIVTGSLDECDARLNTPLAFVRHDQMAQGPFTAEVDRVSDARGLMLSVARYGPAVTSSGAWPDRTYAFMLPLSAPAGVYINHQPLGANEMAVLQPGQEFRLYRPAGFRSAVLRVDEAIADRSCQTLFGLPAWRVLGSTQRFVASEGAVASCARRLAQICDTVARNPKPLNDWTAARGGSGGVAGELLEEIFAMAFTPTPLQGWSKRRTLVDRAWKIIDDSEERPTVGDLCLALGVPIRTLDEAFQACLGMSPKRFVMGMHLNRVRRELSRPAEDTTVTGTATRFGFYHFGHFGARYRHLFGENPQMTLARGRLEAGGSAAVRDALHSMSP
jgi:AraC family ethanolamine operon transcriptional activator